jgi:hypothetical protein
MAETFALAFTAALNPTLLTVTMVMLFAAEPRRLMAGYLLGAYTVSIALGLVIVFALQDSKAVSSGQDTIGPGLDVVLGLLLLLVAFVVLGDRDARVRERHRAHAEAKGPKAPPRWRTALDRGSPRTAFAVGILLTLPGASYLAGMSRISNENLSTAATAGAVVLFCVIMLGLIELPLIGFVVSPERTQHVVVRFTTWAGANARVIGGRIALVLGSLLLLRAAGAWLT